MSALVFVYEHWVKTTWFMIGLFFICAGLRVSVKMPGLPQAAERAARRGDRQEGVGPHHWPRIGKGA